MTQGTTTTNASSFDFEPYGIDANASTMAEFAAAMMRAIAEISVEDYGISSESRSKKSKQMGPNLPKLPMRARTSLPV